MCVFVYVCMYVCMYVCIFIYTPNLKYNVTNSSCFISTIIRERSNAVYSSVPK